MRTMLPVIILTGSVSLTKHTHNAMDIQLTEVTTLTQQDTKA